VDNSQNTEDQLYREVETLRRRLAELEKSAHKLTPDNEALRQSEARYNELFNSIREGIGIVDENEIIQFCNPAFARIFGEISPNDLIGKCLLDYIPESRRDLVRSQTELRRSNKSSQYELEIITARNERKNIWSSISPRFDKNGRYIGAFGNVIDITDRKRMEEALRESEGRYRTLFENTVEGILVADIETKQFRYANPKACRMLGYDDEELRRMHVSDIHPEDALERVISEFEAQARGEITLAENIPCLRKDGTIIYMDINTAKASIDGRECNVGFFHDITERKRTEKIHAILYRITEAAIQASNLREMLEGIRGILAEVIDTTYFYVALHDEENDRYAFPYHADPYGDEYFQPGHLRKTITDYVRKSGQPLMADRRVFKRLEGEGELELIPQTPDIWLGAPLRTGKGVIGVVALQSFERTTYTKADLDLLTTVSGNIAMAIERRKAMDALSESEEKYRLLIENAGEAIFSVDDDGVFLTMNRTAARDLGGEPEYLIGKTMWDLFPKKVADRQMESVRKAIRNGQRHAVDEKTMLKREERWFTVSIYPIRNPVNQVFAAQIIARDITENRQIEMRHLARLSLLDNLRKAENVDQCLKYGCDAIYDARLFKRAVLTLNDENSRIINLGQVGLDDDLVEEAKDSPPLSRETIKKILHDEYRISHSYFVPAEAASDLKSSGRFIGQKQCPDSGKSDWKTGDELFVPILSQKSKFEGWLSVDTPFVNKRPSLDTVIFLEEVVDIVTQQVHQIQDRERLELERQALEEKNIALREVLTHIEEEKMEIKQRITESIDDTLLPILDKLAVESQITNSTYVDLLKSGLIDLASSSGGAKLIYPKLSAREREICMMIRNLATNKEIASTLNIAMGTVRKHRETIRRKLGLTNRKVNLAAYLNNA
jgi:PAS domain S-box-containing protein